VHHSSSDEVQIIQDPNIPYFPPCLVVEECPPSPKEKKRKMCVFVSTLPRRRTRSARSTEATIGWKNMEQTIPILHPLSFVVKIMIVTQEPIPSDNMTVTQEPTSSQNLAVTQEPTSQGKTFPQEPVIPELVVTQEPTAQEETVPQEPIMLELVVTQEPTAQEETVPQEPVIPELAVTQEPITKNNEDNDDVPLAQLFSQIEKKIKSTGNSRITKLMKKNDSLKAELAPIKKELQAA
jgi:hypothetical protein